MSGPQVKSLNVYLEIIEKEENTIVLFVAPRDARDIDPLDAYCDALQRNINIVTKNTVQEMHAWDDPQRRVPWPDSKIYVVVDCECGGKEKCEICSIMAYAQIERLPQALFYTLRVLKWSFYGLKLPEWDGDGTVTPGRELWTLQLCAIRAIYQYSAPMPESWSLVAFVCVNVFSLGSAASTLRALRDAQGLELYVRRSQNSRQTAWVDYFRVRVEEWKATALTAALVSTSAAALLAYSDITLHAISRLFCIASVTFGMGSAAVSTALISNISSVSHLREGWFWGGFWFIIAMSAPTAWLRWGIVALLATLLSHLFLSQPLFIQVLLTLLIGVLITLIGFWPINGLHPKKFSKNQIPGGVLAGPSPPLNFSWNIGSLDHDGWGPLDKTVRAYNARVRSRPPSPPFSSSRYMQSGDRDWTRPTKLSVPITPLQEV